MNVQYLGDRYDYVNYDLLLALAQTFRPPGRVTVIPMLTRARSVAYAVGRRNAALHKLLEGPVFHPVPCLPDTAAAVSAFFGERGVALRFAPLSAFRHDRRADYFGAVDGQHLADCLVFVDPDTGLETRSQNDATHLRCAELEFLFQRLSGASVLLVYQHYQRQSFSATWGAICAALHERTAIRRAVAWDAGEIAFVVVARSPERLHDARHALQAYAHRIAEGRVLSATGATDPDPTVILGDRPPCACRCGG